MKIKDYEIINLGHGLYHMIIPELIKPEGIIIDGGTSEGLLIETLRKMNIHNSILAIEPHKTCFSILQNKNFLNVVLVNMALTYSELPEIDFHERIGYLDRGSTDGRYGMGTNQSRDYKVRVLTLDTLLIGLTVVEYMKLDIEGCETDIVLNMTQEQANKIKQISMEIHNKDIVQLDNKLKELGFLTERDKDTELFGVRL